jgi:PAS domain S-box-containing protein
MSWITIIWSAASGACLLAALMHLLVWFRDRHSWANLCFFATVFGVLGLAVCEMVTMHTGSPEVFGRAIRWTHLVYALGVIGSLGFVHFYFGTGRKWLLTLAIGLRLLAVVANFATGLNLHISAIQSLQEITFLGERVSILGEWVPNPWVRLGWIASLAQLVYVVDASVRLWRSRSPESRKRAIIVGGTLVFFIVCAVVNAGLVSAGVLRMPFIVSFPFLGMLAAMGYELSRDVLSAAYLARDLRESEQRMSLAVGAANMGIWIRDLDRNEMWATDEWRTMFGFTPSEPLNLDRYLQRLHPEDREAVLRVRARAIEGGGSYDTEYRVVLPDGGVRWIASRGRVEFDGMGKAVLVRGVSLDITARKQAEQETLRLRQEITHVGRVSMMGQLASALAAILRNAEAAELFIQDESPDLAEIRAILADIRKDDQRAGTVIERMRTLLKRHDLDMRPLDLGEIVHEVAAVVRTDAASRQVKLQVNVPGDLPPVRGDRVHLQQVLLNLIINGMDALNGARQEDRRVTVSARLDGARDIEIAVKDSGTGIPAEQLTHVFDSFFTTKKDGLGMGLSISRTIIQAHGGRLWAENNEGGGATFRFTVKTAEGADAK